MLGPAEVAFILLILSFRLGFFDIWALWIWFLIVYAAEILAPLIQLIPASLSILIVSGIIILAVVIVLIVARIFQFSKKSFY